MTSFITFQFSQSTAQDEQDYFTGSTRVKPEVRQSALPAGTYRVVDGTLCRVVDGAPPTLQAEPKTTPRDARDE